MNRLKSVLVFVTFFPFFRFFLFSLPGPIFRGKIEKNFLLSKDVHHLEISVDSEHQGEAGQAIAVFSPENVKRFYSISGLTSSLLEICVKRVHGGAVSSFLCDSLPGAELTLQGPMGKDLVLPEKNLPETIVMIGTGTGLAPFRALLTELVSRSFSGKIILIAGAKTLESLPYLSDFRNFQENLPKLEIRLALSQEGDKSYVQDLLGPKDLKTWAEENSMFFICGGKAMGAAVIEKMTEALGPEKMREMKKMKKLRKEVY